MTEQMPIEVQASPVGAQLSAAVRNLLTAAGGYLVGKGWIDASVASALVPVILIAGPMAWAQFRARLNHAQKVTMAEALPNSVAQVKG